MRFSSLLCAASVLAMPVAAYAQQITSSIEGTVTNAAGAPAAGASVVVTDTRTGVSRTIATDSGGRFAARGLTVGGPYSITASAPGLQGQTVEGISTSVQGATTLTFALDAAETADNTAIVVTGQRVNAQLRAIGPGSAFGTETLATAPSFNRDVRDVIRIDPRVSLLRDEGGSNQDRISCLGGNDRTNAFTVDGITQSDIYGLNDTGFSSRSSTPVPYDAVRETQVEFAPFDVEYSYFTGCAINVVTRSGSNQLHGGAFFEINNDDLHGHTAGGRTSGRVLPDKRWGGSISGPIIPDHLFFFFAYEHQESSQSQDNGPVGGPNSIAVPGITIDQFNEISDAIRNIYGIDTGPLVTNLPFTNDRYFGRVDWQINDRHRLEVTYQHLNEGSLRPDDFFTGSSPQIVGENTYFISGTRSDYVAGRLYSNWTDNFSTEIRYSHSEVTDRQDPFGGGEAQSDNPIPRIIVGVPSDDPNIPNGAVLAGPGTSRSANDLRTRVDQFRALARLEAGRHSFKLGFDMNRAHIFNLFVQNATGTLVFRNIDDLEAGLLSPGTGNNQTSTLPNNIVSGATEGAFGNFSGTGDINDAAARFTRTIFSAYLQDDWQATDQLNIVAGVRTDWYSGGHPQLNPNFVTRFGFGNDTGFSALNPILLPRIGFTYNLNDFGFIARPQIHGGVGIFSGGDPLVWFGNAFQNNGIAFATGTTQSARCPTGQISVLQGGQFTGVPDCFQQDAIDTASAAQGAVQSIDPDIKSPTVLRANIGFQGRIHSSSGFFNNWRFNVDYIWSRFRNPLGLVDLAETPNPARGLSGFAIDGRPLYQQIDASLPGCDATLTNVGVPPVWTNVSPACFTTASNRVNELMLTNERGYTSQIASFILSKEFSRGIFTQGGSVSISLGYAYTDAHDRMNMFASTASSNYGGSAAFDRQDPDSSTGFFNTRHNISFSGNFREKFFGDYATNFGFFFNARSGRPYSLTFSGSGAFAPSQAGSANALVYVPTGTSDPNISPSSNMTAVADLANFLGGLSCARHYAGRTIARNTCSNDWYYDLDLTFSQEVPGPASLFGVHDRMRLYLMFDNFLNFLDSNWNVFHRRQFSGLQDVAGTSGVDAQGRYIITSFRGAAAIAADNQVQLSSSLWRIKVGVSYNF